MGKLVQIVFVVTTIVVSVLVYSVKYDTGRDAIAVTELKRQIDIEFSALSVLKAEWSLLNQPDRLQRLASKFLNMQPLKPAQYASLNDIIARADNDRLDDLVMQALNPAKNFGDASVAAPLPPKKP